MLALSGAIQGIGSIQVLMALLVIGIAIFWRTVLKVMIFAATILILMLITSGAATLLEGVHHLMK